MIDAAEQDGGVCRDDSSAAIVGGGSGTGVELRWWTNIFVGYNWGRTGKLIWSSPVVVTMNGTLPFQRSGVCFGARRSQQNA